MYLDKGIRDHTLLQAIARVNRPYNELKKVGVVIDYYGLFDKLEQALNFDKNELGEDAGILGEQVNPIDSPFGRHLLRETPLVSA
jgi:type I site-specific restriction-modification system R (restriction) subunit